MLTNRTAAPITIGGLAGGVCAANHVNGNLVAQNNVVDLPNPVPTGVTAVVVAGNTVGGGVTVSGNGWAPTSTTASALVAGNTIAGTLACAANNGAPTNQGHPNTVGGHRTGQCAAL